MYPWLGRNLWRVTLMFQRRKLDSITHGDLWQAHQRGFRKDFRSRSVEEGWPSIWPRDSTERVCQPNEQSSSTLIKSHPKNSPQTSRRSSHSINKACYSAMTMHSNELDGRTQPQKQSNLPLACWTQSNPHISNPQTKNRSTEPENFMRNILTWS